MDETTRDEVPRAKRGARSSGGGSQALGHLVAVARLDPGLAALVVMAVVGLCVSIYLTIAHYDTRLPLVCPTSGHINCVAVTSSQWSLVPGTKLPITFPGIVWFAVSGGLAIALLGAVAAGQSESRRLRQAQLVWSILGALTVLYLVYVEIVRLQFTFCEWCTVVHLMTFASFVIVVDRVSRVPMVAAPAGARAAAMRSRGTARGVGGTPAALTTRPNGTRPSSAGRPNGARPASVSRRPAQKARSKR